MRKNKLLISTLLPVAAFVSVVGAGYSAWYFQGEATADTTTGITVTPVVAGGGIAVTSSGHGLTLDQEDTTHNTSASGITWNDITLTYTADKTATGERAEGTGTITWTVTTPDDFEAWVNIKKSGTWTITNLYEDKTFTLVGGEAGVGGEEGLNLSYKAEPTNYTEWSKMNTALNGKTITVKFEVKYNYTQI